MSQDNDIVIDSSLSDTPQTICFNPQKDCSTAKVMSKTVVITRENGQHASTSSNIELKNIVDYTWDKQFKFAQIHAVHMSGKYVAYGVKANTLHTDKNQAMARVINCETDNRGLIRHINGQVRDLAFAHIPDDVILGLTDDDGTLFVYKIETGKTGNVGLTMLLTVTHDPNPALVDCHRLIWCDYIPGNESESETESSHSQSEFQRFLVLTHGHKGELYDLSKIMDQYPSGSIVHISDLTDVVQEMTDHTDTIVDGIFSPDGNAVATASLDGYVKFFQVYFHSDMNIPRCMHHWQPHDGREMSSIFFLDDHSSRNPSDAQFWRLAITGCEKNRELKVFELKSWTCLQTIRFHEDDNACSSASKLGLKVSLDPSSTYLLASDLDNRVLYVMKIVQQNDTAYISTVTRFLLTFPILNMAIVNAHMVTGPAGFEGVARVNDANFDEDDDSGDDGFPDQDMDFGTRVELHLFLVQPKSLQDCYVVYDPIVTEVNQINTSEVKIIGEKCPELPLSVLSDKSEAIVTSEKDYELSQLLPPIIPALLPSTIPSGNILPTAPNLIPPLNLMTPDAFSSSKVDSVHSASDAISIFTTDEAREEELSVATLLNNFDNKDLDHIFNNHMSTTSSPSREVEQILSIKRKSLLNGDETVVASDLKTEIDPVIVIANDSEVSVAAPEQAVKLPVVKPEWVRKSDETRLVNGEGNKSAVAKDYPDAPTYHQVDLNPLYGRIAQLEAKIEQQNDALKHMQTFTQIGLAEMLDKRFDQQNIMFEKWRKEKATKEIEFQEKLLSAVVQVITNSVICQLDAVISREIKMSVVPTLTATLEPLKTQIHNELASKLTATDVLLRENLAKLCESKSVMDVLSRSVITTLRPQIEQTYRDVMQNTILPRWDRTSAKMFQQINETFLAGTKEYTCAIEAYCEKQRRAFEKTREPPTPGVNLQAVQENIRIAVEQIIAGLKVDVQQQLFQTTNSIQDGVKKVIHTEVKSELDKSFKSHMSQLEDSMRNSISTRSSTPHVDVQTQQLQINQQIQQGRVGEAFQQALSASDLSLVVYTCEQVNPDQLFNQKPFPIQPYVLLSLIQQLSADMNHNTELQCKYLQESLLALDRSDPIVQKHVKVVLREVQKNLKAYLASGNNSDVSTIKHLKMLLLATTASDEI